MCGISGILSKSYKKSEFAQKTGLLQQHRGPDNFGESLGNGFHIIHNRLTIIDLNERSNQPLENENEVLIYNGEIYNYKTLFEKYFPNQSIPPSDTLALFELLKIKGSDILQELNGMFAFLFIDKSKQTALFARDRMGIKPFYYTLENGNFYFASEIKSILNFRATIENQEPTLDAFHFEDLLTFGHTEFQQVPFQQIEELAPGHFGTFEIDSSTLNLNAYFKLVDQISRTDYSIFKKEEEKELINHLDKLLHHAVESHLLSDAEIGTLCSGGLDSSLMTAIALKYYPGIKIYHAGTDNREAEEPYAEIVAKHLGIDITYSKMTPETYLQNFAEAIYHADLPMFHPSDVSLFEIAKTAKKDGTKVLLCGEGADELFGGYNWHWFFKKNLNQAQGIKNLWNKLMLLKTKIAYHLGFFEFGASREQFLDLSAAYVNYSNYDPYRKSKIIALRRNNAGFQHFQELLAAYEEIYPNSQNTARIAAFISNNLSGHLSTLLHRNDRMCMMASVEARVPFLENDLVNFALNLHPEWKLRAYQRKYLLKKVAERYLPKKIVHRKKLGFQMPFEKYLAAANKEILHNGFLSEYLNVPAKSMLALSENDNFLLFQLLSIEVWGRIFLKREDRAEISKKLSKFS